MQVRNIFPRITVRGLPSCVGSETHRARRSRMALVEVADMQIEWGSEPDEIGAVVN